MINSRLTIQKDSYVEMDMALMYAKIAEKYTCSVTGLIIKGLAFKDVKERILKTYPDTVIVDYKTNSVHESWVFEHDDFFLVCESMNSKKQYGFDIFAKDYTKQKEFYDLLKEYEDRSGETYIGIYSYFQTQQGLKDAYSVKQAKDFTKLKPAFYPYLDTKELFDQFILSEDNMLVLTGLPGTGKCLDGNEEIEIEMSDEVYEKLFTD